MIDHWLRVVVVTGRVTRYSLPVVAVTMLSGVFVDWPMWVYWLVAAPIWVTLTLVVVPAVVFAAFVALVLWAGMAWGAIWTLIGPRKD